MKPITFFVLLIGIQLMLVFIEIHKHMQFIKYSFAKQKQEKYYQSLLHEKEHFYQELCRAQDMEQVKQFALALGMQSVKMNQIKHIKFDAIH